MKRRISKKIRALAVAVAVCLGACPAFAQNADVRTEEGRVAKDIWSGYWWPTGRGEILVPLQKYDVLAGAKSAQWERANRPAGPNVPKWVGLCHAWAASSVLEAEPRSVLVYAGRARLAIGDQKGWLAVCHSGDVANNYGLRYNGPGDDPNDLAPDALWDVLRSHIKDRGVSVILDIESREEVWNYPVYAYRVTHRPKPGSDSVREGKICVWMADDAVAKNFVGTRRIYQEYTFEAEFVDGSIVVGTGKWTGDSERVHPDFAWFPYVVRPENPEVDYNKVCALLKRRPVENVDPPVVAPNATPAPTPETETPTPAPTPETETPTPAPTPETETPTPAPTPETPTPVPTPETETPTPAPTPETPTPTPTPETETIAEDSVDDEGVALTVANLFALIENQKSDFRFDVSLIGRLNGLYQEGEFLQIGGVSEENGYLYLFAINPAGEVSVLYPQANDDNRVRAGETFELPTANAGYAWRLSEPFGEHRIKAVVAEKPLVFTGSVAPTPENARTTFADEEKVVYALQDLALRLTPSEKAVVDEAKKGGAVALKGEIANQLGRYAQDEIVLAVVPQSAGKNSVEKEDVVDKADAKK